MKQKILAGVLAIGLFGVFGMVGAQTTLDPGSAFNKNNNTQKATITTSTVATSTATTITATSTTPAPVETTVTVGSTVDGDGRTTGTLIIDVPSGEVTAANAPTSFEDPRTTGTERTYAVVVTSVVQASVASPTATQAALSVHGKAKPFQIIVIYLFSTPTIVVVKADANGNWEYTFSKDLPDGDHQVYAAVVDNKGSIAAKSQPVGFIKQAAAITVSGTLPDLTPEPPSIASGPYVMALSILIGLLLAYALVFFGQKYWRPTEVIAKNDDTTRDL
ncbi:MAG: Ig-like domain-containing protein [Minisyncoccota bacterium]